METECKAYVLTAIAYLNHPDNTNIPFVLVALFSVSANFVTCIFLEQKKTFLYAQNLDYYVNSQMQVDPLYVPKVFSFFLFIFKFDFNAGS